MSEERVTLRFDTFQEFLDECSDRISEQGMFLATEAVRPVGSKVEFELGLDDEFPLLRGSGEVLWVVEANGEAGPPGMAVRYDKTDEATATLARKIADRQRARGAAAFDLDRAAAGEVTAEAPAAAEEPPEAGPSFATQAVDALIVDAPEAAEPTPAVAAIDSEAETLVETTPDQAAPALETQALPTLEMPPDVAEEPMLDTPSTGKRSRGGLWATLALIVALTGVAYWQRGFLLEKLGGDRAPSAPDRTAESVADDAGGPGSGMPIEPEAEPGVALEPPAEPVAEAPTSPPAGPLSAIEEIRWQATDAGTLLELAADGTFPAEAARVERLEDPPRLLLKIPGVAAPMAAPTVAVGTEEVVGVRTALHGSPPSSELHVVVDLADPTAQGTVTRAEGSVLQVRISSAAISP